MVQYSAAPSGAAGGDLSGTYPNPGVAKSAAATFAMAGNATVGGTLGVTGATALAATTVTGQATVNGTIADQPAASNSVVLSSNVTGTDTFDRYRLDGAGNVTIGSGALARDVTYGRTAAGVLGLTSTHLDVATAGFGLRVAEGSNAKQGVSTLVAGTVTVSNTSVTATSRIMLTVQSLGTVTAPKAVAVTARTAATSFTITSADATDTSVVAWQIFEVG